MTKQSRFPKGYDEKRVKRVLHHYESLTEDQAVAEDEAAWEDPSQTFVEVPNELVPAVRGRGTPMKLSLSMVEVAVF